MSKSEILTELKNGRKQFLKALEGLSEQDMQEPSVVGEWSVKDTIVHLTMWEAELVKLLWQASQGIKPTTAHFSDESFDQINAKWYQSNLSRNLERVMEDFHGVRRQTIHRVESFTEDELTDPDRYNWLKGLSLQEKVARSSFKHEAEHEEQIRKWRQEREIQPRKNQKER